MFHDKGFIVVGFAAIGKSTLASKYSDRVIDLGSGEYQWDNKECDNIPCDQPKGSTVARCQNPEWPKNYYKAIIDAVEHYDIVLTSMHWELLDYLEANGTEYYLAFPSLDSADTLIERCYQIGNDKVVAEGLMSNLSNWYSKLSEYHLKKLLWIERTEYLEDVLIREKLLRVPPRR